MPRYLPVQLDAANEDIRAVYQQVESQLGMVPNLVKTLAHSPNFLQPVAELYGRLLGETGLSERLRQLVILKTCKLDKCKQTVSLYSKKAQEAGWTDQQIEAMDDLAATDLFTYYEKEVLRLTELVIREPDDIQNDFWTQLDNHFTSDQVVELVVLIAFFSAINRVLLTLEVEADPESQPELQEAAQASS